MQGAINKPHGIHKPYFIKVLKVFTKRTQKSIHVIYGEPQALRKYKYWLPILSFNSLDHSIKGDEYNLYLMC